MLSERIIGLVYNYPPRVVLCCLDIKPLFLPGDVSTYSQCPCLFFTLEGYKLFLLLCDHRL